MAGGEVVEDGEEGLCGEGEEIGARGGFLVRRVLVVVEVVFHALMPFRLSCTPYCTLYLSMAEGNGDGGDGEDFACPSEGYATMPTVA